MKRSAHVCVCLVLLLALLLPARPTAACPFCLAPPETWAEILDKADVVLVAEVVELHLFRQQIKVDVSAETVFRIRAVLKAPGQRPDFPAEPQPQAAAPQAVVQESLQMRAFSPFRPGRCVTVQEFVTARRGELFLLTAQRLQPLPAETETPPAAPAASQPRQIQMVEAVQSESGDATSVVQAVADATSAAPGALSVSDIRVADAVAGVAVRHSDALTFPELLEWSSPAALTPALLDYIAHAPANNLPTRSRLLYYVRFLESADAEIASDAWGEFAKSAYEDVVAVRQQFSPELLRTWIADPATGPERLGLYGMMLGLCGNPADADFLLQHICPHPPAKEFRYGTEGLMGGYLLLAGEPGLACLEERLIRRPGVTPEELFAVIQALQFIWSYEQDVIAPARLRSGLHLLLDNPQMREVVITDLARWQDWATAPRLIELFSQLPDDDQRSRRAIIGFMLALQRAAGGTSAAGPAVAVELSAQCGQFLASVTESHPQLLESARRELGEMPRGSAADREKSAVDSEPQQAFDTVN